MLVIKVASLWRVVYAKKFACTLQVCVPLPAWGIRAGARETIYFNPAETNVAIVTCGGLCPGLNDVVQGLVRKLEDYGVPEGNILGIRCVSSVATSHRTGNASHPCLAALARRFLVSAHHTCRRCCQPVRKR